MTGEIEKLKQLVFGDERLFEDLHAIEDRSEFISELARIAASHGIAVSEDAITAEMTRNKRVWIERWI